MTAAYRLKGFGWFAGCTAIVLGFYLVSLQVASERKELEHLDADIASTQRDIRALETEFDTRANLAQLERWNGDTLALSAPVPGQFLRDPAELASAEVIRGAGAPTIRTAALIVPSFVAAPVAAAPQAAAASPAPAAPTAVAVASSRRAPVQPAVAPARPGAIEVAQAAPVVPARSARIAIAQAVARTLPRVALSRAAYRPDAEPVADAARPRAQVALLDRKLLSDSTLRDLVGGARAEGGKLR